MACRPMFGGFSVGVLFVAAAATAPVEESTPLRPPPDFYEHSLRPMLKRYCLDCHSGEDAEKGVKLDAYPTAESVAADRKTWTRVFRMIRTGEMPPEDNPRPPQSERLAAVEWLEKVLGQVDCGGPIDPGRVTIRRLNRVEYNNTVRDLLGIDFHACR